MMQRRFIAIILLGVLFNKICLADNVTPIGRYSTVVNKPKLSQVDLLSQPVQVRFAQSIQTVGDAVEYLLRFSGYSLIPEYQRSIPVKITLDKPLPVVDRELGPITLKEGLITLIGPAFYLIQDPVNRVVSFKLKSAYQKFINKKLISRGDR